MKYKLVDIKNGKICGIYGGRSEKYYDIWNYVCSTDIKKSGYAFDNIEEAKRVKRALDGAGLLQPAFEIICIENQKEN